MKAIKNRRRKGMTLIEIIIAVAVVAVMSSVLIVAAGSVNSYLHSARDVNDKVSVQAPFAEANFRSGDDTMLANDVQIKVSGDVSGHLDPGEDGNLDFALSGEVYRSYTDVERLVKSGYTEDDAKDEVDKRNEFGRGLNLKFVDNVEAPTNAPAGP